MSAQKYPEDFDAILAGAPANYQTHLHAWDLSVAMPVLKDPAAAVPAAKLAVINRAVLNACDARDGVTDGVLNDPRTLHVRRRDAAVQGGRCRGLPDRAAGRGGEARVRAGEDRKRRARVSRARSPAARPGWGVIRRRTAGARRLGRLVPGRVQRRQLGSDDVRPRHAI